MKKIVSFSLIILLIFFFWYFGRTWISFSTACLADLGGMKLEKNLASLQEYKRIQGLYPTRMEELSITPQSPSTGSSMMLANDDDLKDPWNRNYIYFTSHDRTNCKLIALGADGKIGGLMADFDREITCENSKWKNKFVSFFKYFMELF